MRITREWLAELAHYNAGIKAARADYYAPEPTGCVACGDDHLCAPHRRKAKAHLRVATSVEECAELLALLDLPRPRRGHEVTKPCGTPAAYARHISHGEKACEACLVGIRAYKSDRLRARNLEAVRRYRAKKSGGAT